MRIDIVSVFPDYFDVLNLSLLGKAQDKGLLQVTAHNLRDWTHDVHRTVDDTPVGGGAGMVMKPEIWAQCLDDVLGLTARELEHVELTLDDDMPVGQGHSRGTSVVADVAEATEGTQAVQSAQAGDTEAGEVSTLQPESATTAGTGDAEACDADVAPVSGPKQVLIFPNPSAPLFTQQAATELSRAQQLVFGCGRYEGIDARVPRYYAEQGVDVREYSIGDYVLNGGEVAVSAMIEAIVRLIPGFMGNPESIVEESYTGDALLEHRPYTKPTTWRGIAVPPVLISGNHAKVDRYRRDEAIMRTNAIRPDLIEQLDCKRLDKADRKLLMSLGWEVSLAHPRKKRG